MPTEDKFVYLVVDPDGRQPDYVDLIGVLNVIWRRKKLILAAVFVITAISITYALLATPVYRSQVILAPVDENSSTAAILGQMEGLVGLAGLSVSTDRKTIDALAVLNSKDFTRAFIRDENLLPILFSDEWDAEKREWKASDPLVVPDLRDAVELFSKTVRTVKEDGKTGLVTLSIEWSDPVLAAKLANSLAKRLNQTLRTQAIDRAKYNIEYLREEMSGARVVSVQQAISRLLENEMKTLMLARGNEEFAFRIIDAAEESKLRIWPRRSLIVAVGMFAGLLLSIVFVLVQDAFLRDRMTRAAKAEAPTSQP